MQRITSIAPRGFILLGDFLLLLLLPLCPIPPLFLPLLAPRFLQSRGIRVAPGVVAHIGVSVAGVSRVAGRILTAPAMNAHNTFEDTDAVRPTLFQGVSLEGSSLAVELPPMCVVALELR